jgi:hypothetical protein
MHVAGNGDLASFRSRIEALRQGWSEEDELYQFGNRVTTRLTALYEASDAEHRRIFDEVLADWVRSEDTGTWRDGEVLISHFDVCSAIPALREVLELWEARLAHAIDVGDGELRSQALSRVSTTRGTLERLESACGEESDS